MKCGDANVRKQRCGSTSSHCVDSTSPHLTRTLSLPPMSLVPSLGKSFERLIFANMLLARLEPARQKYMFVASPETTALPTKLSGRPAEHLQILKPLFLASHVCAFKYLLMLCVKLQISCSGKPMNRTVTNLYTRQKFQLHRLLICPLI